MKAALIGLGAAGLSFLYNCYKLNTPIEIDVYDVGIPYNKRIACPIDRGLIKNCPPKVGCLYCIPGQSGGSFNDFKVITSASEDIGGLLYQLVGKEKLQEGLDKVQAMIRSHFDKDIPNVSPSLEDVDYLSRLISDANSKLLYHPQTLVHCGTDNAPKINSNILEDILDNYHNVNFYWNQTVKDVVKSSGKFIVTSDVYKVLPSIKDKQHGYVNEYDLVVIAVGRGGTKWLSYINLFKDLIRLPGRVDIGVRVETSQEYTKELDKRFYEPKLSMISTKYKDTIRNFCSNPGGFVIPEHHKEYILVNGHSKTNEKSKNTNFAVLVSKILTPPFENPQTFSQTLAKAVNMLGGHSVICQRLGDLLAGRRTTSLSKNSIQPTLEVLGGDISMAFPYRILDGIMEYLQELDLICPGVASNDTILYAPEVKTYPDFIKVDKNMQTNIQNLYIIGDCSSQTRSVGQAMVSGILASEGIANDSTR